MQTSEMPLLGEFQGMLLVHPKEKMQAEFSKMATANHASHALIHCKQKSEESLTVFIYRLGELLMQCCGISPEHCRDKFKIDLFTCQLSKRNLLGESLGNTLYQWHIPST